ncbi:uncharacterized protein LY89DRAFT_731506 [Mollisia scopiformis]|uniref:2EXR domain-containing protein n=1 Tax=Mollisia scopiformis TaxID=149040 RepID=A0A194XFY5_MOLSC|nr:uncharacterized protein LY89DRAFT_731506 [Mollisia scopiformis]KUJ19083.1 hypothetical protein LY89DRAFT_731506 [Mollisia scopiformis]
MAYRFPTGLGNRESPYLIDDEEDGASQELQLPIRNSAGEAGDKLSVENKGDDFHYFFEKLPQELKDMIWKEVFMFGERTILVRTCAAKLSQQYDFHYDILPTTLWLDHKTKDVAMKRNKDTLGNERTTNCRSVVHFNKELDWVHIGEARGVQLTYLMFWIKVEDFHSIQKLSINVDQVNHWFRIQDPRPHILRLPNLKSLRVCYNVHATIPKTVRSPKDYHIGPCVKKAGSSFCLPAKASFGSKSLTRWPPGAPGHGRFDKAMSEIRDFPAWQLPGATPPTVEYVDLHLDLPSDKRTVSYIKEFFNMESQPAREELQRQREQAKQRRMLAKTNATSASKLQLNKDVTGA